MKVEFLSKFSKDLDRINIKSVKSNLVKLINQIESSENLVGIQNIKKLVGHKSAYRVRIADYRVGFFYENEKNSSSRSMPGNGICSVCFY